jgi:NAD(P)-dependent dehydrogenase (short-subunit alcohol dehydrogenase family)
MADAWDLRDRVVLVTGAGKGLGRGAATRLAAAGAKVLLVARTRADLDSARAEIEAAGGEAATLVADVTDEAAVAEAVHRAEELGDLRGCVCAAGTNITGPAVDYPLEYWDALFAINVRATFATARAAGASMLRRGVEGSIVTMSSQMGTVGFPERSAYCATKHAVEGLTKALAVEWAAEGVRVNAVAPTFVDTPMTRPMFEDAEFSAEVMRRLPQRRLATVGEVAEAVFYLTADASRSTTGQVLRVDGGWTAW